MNFMVTLNHNYTCPVCGFDQLTTKPYLNMPELSQTRRKAPPYALLWGRPSYEVCSCCGFEFGFDDDTGLDPASDQSFEDYLKVWVTVDHCQWLEPELKPAGWSLKDQLKKAGLEVPDYLSRF